MCLTIRTYVLPEVVVILVSLMVEVLRVRMAEAFTVRVQAVLAPCVS
jgi:hypothetical protein